MSVNLHRQENAADSALGNRFLELTVYFKVAAECGSPAVTLPVSLSDSKNNYWGYAVTVKCYHRKVKIAVTLQAVCLLSHGQVLNVYICIILF